MSKINVGFLVCALAILVACKSQTTTISTKSNDLAESVETAQASANHFGDETLSCEAIQKEFTSVVNDPALQTYMAQSGMEGQNAEWARVMAAQSGTPIQRARGAQNAQQQMEKMNEIAATVMPHMARAQRLMQLSVERKCAWMLRSQASGADAADARH